MNWRLRIFFYVISGLFWLPLVALLALGKASVASPRELAPFLALAVAGEALVIGQRRGSSMLSFSALAHVAAAIVLGPASAALVAAMGVVVVDGSRAASRRNVGINSSMFGGAIWLGGYVYQLCGSTSSHIDMRSLPALAALIAVRYATTTLVFAIGTTVATAARLTYVFRELVWEELGSATAEGSLGVLLAIGLSGNETIVLPFLIPLLAALYASKSTYERLKEETAAALQSLARVIDERDPRTAEHTNRVASYVEMFADAIQLPQRERERLVEAAAYHDLGKIAVDVSTLVSAERLSEEELRTIKRHPRLSARLLSPFGFAREIARYVELHHERYDGRGYYAVPAQDIPMEAHVLIVADSFDAMTSIRPYRPALTIDEAAHELLDKAGTQFHPLVARAFAALVRREPLTSELSAQELAALRRSFVPVRRMKPVGTLVPNLETLTFALVCLSLVLFGIRGVSHLATATVIGFTAVSGVSSVIAAGRGRRRWRVAEEAISGGEPLAALEAANVDGWVIHLEPTPEDNGYRVVRLWPPNVAAAEVEEATNWALRREEELEVELHSGRRLFLTPARGADGSRFAIGVDGPTDRTARRVIARLVERLQDLRPEPSTIELVRSEERRAKNARTRALVVVELGMFEDVRRSAGQLFAQQLVEDAEARLRSLLRDGDLVARLGDDALVARVSVADRQGLERIRDRVKAEMEQIRAPRRTREFRPAIACAFGDEVDADARLAALERDLAGGRTTVLRAAG
jgi:GGDEF domain-containing protein